MSILTERDYRSLLNTLYRVNCCQDTESFLGALMPSMMQMFHVQCITFHLIKGSPWQIKTVESRSFKNDGRELHEDKVFPALYQAGLYQKSPLLKQALSSSKTILRTGESISLKDWERSDLYNNFILPQNLYRELFMALHWKNRLEGMITLWRSPKEADYQIRDICQAEMLAPHLVVALHNISSTTRINNLQAHLTAGGEANREGLLLLNHQLKPVYFNSKAKQICRQLNSGILAELTDCGEDDFPIPNPILEDCSELFRQLKIYEQPILWPKERIIISENNLKVRTECSLIWRSDQINPQPNYIINLRHLEDEGEPGIELQVRFHLSKRELEIIYYIVKGLSYGEIAEKLCISKLTVHTHIKNIYRKLGTKNRTELYRYVQAPNWP